MKYFKIFCVFICIALQASTQQFVLKAYTAKDGLPSSDVRSISMDSVGYLWMATARGLCRFDGKNFSTYSPLNTIPIANLYAAFSDHNDHIWAFTYTGNTDNGVIEINGPKARLFHLQDSGKNADLFYGFRETREHKIIAFTDIGLFQFNDTIFKRIDLPFKTTSKICYGYLETPAGSYFNFRTKIICQKPDGTTEQIASSEEGFGKLKLLKIFNGQPYVSTDSGLCVIHNKKLELVFRGSLQKDFIFDFLVDKHQRLWVLFNSNGVHVSPPNNFSNLETRLPISNNFSVRILETKDGNIWIANYEGLIKIKDSYVKEYNHKRIKNISNIGLNPIDSSAIVISPTDGIYQYTKADTFIHNRQFPLPAINQFDFDHYYWSYIDDQKRLWLLSVKGNIYLVSQNKWKQLPHSFFGRELKNAAYDIAHKKLYVCNAYLFYGDESGFDSVICSNTRQPIHSPNSVAVFNNGNILVTTTDSGLLLLNQKKECFNLNRQLGIITISENYNDLIVLKDPEDGFWVVNGNGNFTRYKWKGEAIRKDMEITRKDGLLDNTIISIAYDNFHRLWANTPNGLLVIEFAKTQTGYKPVIHHFDRDYNIDVPNWQTIKLMADKSHNIWFTYYNAIYKVAPDQVLLKVEVPGVNIEEVKLNNEGTDWRKWSDSLAGFFKLPVHPQMPYHLNTLNISFNAISFSDDKEIFYTYRVEGLNSNWMESASNSVTLANLAPGNYRFYVRAKKANTGWSKPAMFSFTINPPFWDTIWFHILSVLAGSFTLLIIYSFRINQVQKKANTQNQLQKLEMKALKAQMNPHFIYNALNSIQSLVLDDKQDESLKYISKFSRLLRLTLENSETNLITLEKELASLELYIQLESLRLNFEFHYSIVVDEEVIPEKEFVPPLILQPYIENAIWHGLSFKEGEKQLMIRVTASDDNEYLICDIIDNGIGRTKANDLKSKSAHLHKSKGMDITSKRLGLFNGNDNSYVEINDLIDEFQSPEGTHVRIRIKRNA